MILFKPVSYDSQQLKDRKMAAAVCLQVFILKDCVPMHHAPTAKDCNSASSA